MYETPLDKITGHLAKMQTDARTMAAIGNAGVECGTMCLDMLAAAVAAAENMSHCLTLQCRQEANRYLPPDSPLLDMSA